MSLPSVFVPALPVTGSAAGERGEKGRLSKTEPGRSRRRKGDWEAQRVREAQPSMFCLLRVASSSAGNSHQPCPEGSCWLGRDGGIHPSSLRGSKQAENLRNTF